MGQRRWWPEVLYTYSRWIVGEVGGESCPGRIKWLCIYSRYEVDYAGEWCLW